MGKDETPVEEEKTAVENTQRSRLGIITLTELRSQSVARNIEKRIGKS